MSKRKRAMSWVLGKVYMEWEKQDQNRTVSCSTTKLEREKQTAKNTEKKGKIGQLSSLGPGLYWFWQLINVGAEVRTTMSTWVWHGLKHCWGLCLGDRESPPMSPLKSLLPSFGQKHQQEKVLTCTYYGIQALEVFYWTVAWKVTVFHGCCTVAVKIHRLLSICHFFFFPFFITSSTIALKLVGRQKPSRLHLTGSETNFRIVAKVTGEQIWSHLD